VTSSEDPGRSLPPPPDPDRAPTWPRVAVVAGALVLAFFVSRSCQQDQVRVTKEEAITIAEREVDFEPVNTQVRFLRQGLNRQPFWFVSLSIPAAGDEESFSRLVVVRVDATSGEVENLSEREPRGKGGDAAGKPERSGGS
jgi:hypothetical protein